MTLLRRGAPGSGLPALIVCIAKGVQASHTDFLIAAAAIIRGYAVLSADQDFKNIARIVPVLTYGQR